MLGKKYFILILLILIAYTLSGCGSLGMGQSADIKVYAGTRGLDVLVLRGSPPNRVYEEEPFKIVSKLSNKGAHPINNGIFTIEYEREYMQLIAGQKSQRFNLEGKTPFSSWDDETVLTFDLKTKCLDEKSEIHTSTILLTACYNYETIATFSVCIDTNIFETRPIDKTCVVSDMTSSGQGAPLAVVKVEQDMSGGEYIIPHFTIQIQNKGHGYVMNYGNLDACTSRGIGEDNFNVVDLYDVELSDYSLRNGQIICSPSSIRLRNNMANFRCYLSQNLIRSTDPSFITDLKIHLRYSYKRTDALEIDILNDLGKCR